jgi:hypothetical protein
MAVGPWANVAVPVHGLSTKEAPWSSCGAYLQRLVRQLLALLHGKPEAHGGDFLVFFLNIVGNEKEGIGGGIMAEGQLPNLEIQGCGTAVPSWFWGLGLSGAVIPG